MTDTQNADQSIPQSARDRWAELVDQVSTARQQYYGEDHPVLADADYDRLFAELEDLGCEVFVGVAIESGAPISSNSELQSPAFHLKCGVVGPSSSAQIRSCSRQPISSDMCCFYFPTHRLEFWFVVSSKPGF